MSLQTKTTPSSACFCSGFLHGPEIPFASKGISVKHIYRCWRRKWKAPALFWKPQSSQTKPTKRFSPYNTPPDLLSLRMWGLGTSTRPHLPLGVICISETKIPDGNRSSVHAGPKKKNQNLKKQIYSPFIWKVSVQSSLGSNGEKNKHANKKFTLPFGDSRTTLGGRSPALFLLLS